MTFYISSVQTPIFETEYKTGNLVSVLKETTENYYCLPKTVKESRVAISWHHVRVALLPLKTVHRRGNIL